MPSLNTLRGATVPLTIPIAVDGSRAESQESAAYTIAVAYRPWALDAAVERQADAVLRNAVSPDLAGARVSAIVARATIASWDLTLDDDDPTPIPLTDEALDRSNHQAQVASEHVQRFVLTLTVSPNWAVMNPGFQE